MRLHFPNLTRPKKAAQRVARLLTDRSLSLVQGAVARGLGYSDWHELERSHASGVPSALDQSLSPIEFRQRATAISLRLSDALGIGSDTAQFALSVARLTGDRGWSPEDHVVVRTACWRQGVLPFTGSRAPGAIVRVGERGAIARRAWLCQMGPLARAFEDAGTVTCVDWEIKGTRVPMPDFVPLRLWLPYGWWTTGDGSEVLFSRDYSPLWRIRPDGSVERTEPWEWIDDIQDEHWFIEGRRCEWHAPAVRAAATVRLQKHGITGLPKLVEALPVMCQDNVESIKTAVECMTPTPRPQNARWW